MTSEKRFRVLTGEWHHETNTFSILPTKIQHFYDYYFFSTEESIRKERYGTKSVLGATYELAEKYEWILTNTVSAQANPAGRVANEAFEEIAEHIIKPIREASTSGGDNCYDGILLHLHGAMVTESYEDAEGELLRRIREIVGDDIPIIVTLDLHGNITKEMAKYATSLIAVRTYPHIDYYEISMQAGDLLHRCMLKEVRPVTVIAKRPQLWGLDGGKTYSDSPMMHLIKRGEVLEKNGDCLVISICAGFAAADIYEIGPSVTVTIDLNKTYPSLFDSDSHQEVVNNETNAIQFAQKIAEEFMDYVWETKHIKTEIYRTVGDMVTYIQNYISSVYQTCHKPLVVADVTDNPGSGHYGDATNVLKGLIDANIPDTVFYAIYDPQAVLEGEKIGVGRVGTITLGGKFDSCCGGHPLTLKGKVVSLTDGCFQTFGPMGFGGVWQNYGLSLMFRVENTSIDVIVITHNGQLLDLAQITSMGCDPLHKKVIAVKSRQHYRACLTPIAGDIITVDGGGLGSAILNGGLFKFARRPIWPLDKDNM